MTSASSWRDGIRRSLPRPDDHVIVLFGATGGRARRKLLPGLFHLFAAGLLPGKCRIIGSARRALTSQQFRAHARQPVAEFGTTKPAGEARGAFERALSSAAPGNGDGGIAGAHPQSQRHGGGEPEPRGHHHEPR
jgi:glucose-6-phosphate 1-dehydrogenase